MITRAPASRFLRLITAMSLLLAACSELPSEEVAEREAILTAEQLACQLSDVNNPFTYRGAWEALRNNEANVAMFWNDIVPKSTSACGRRVRTMFWELAVPDNWAWVNQRLFSDWPWEAGGYFAQTLWMNAVPGNVAPVAAMPGWPRAQNEGYYRQEFWLHAVPDNWASRSRQAPGWPWDSGGYYAQWFWMAAVPGSWSRPFGGQIIAPDAVEPSTDFSAPLGYYEREFWQHAIPESWAVRHNIGGWYGGGPDDGYYKQWFWLHAAPDHWASHAQPLPPAYRSNPSITEKSPTPVMGSTAGYYASTFYHEATIKDFAWYDQLSLRGSAGAGYYAYYFHNNEFLDANPTVSGFYRALRDLAERHLGLATPAARARGDVRRWFRPDAHVVVIFTFDEETYESKGKRLRQAMRNEMPLGQAKGTFFIPWAYGPAIRNSGSWQSDLAAFDLGNHTVIHPPLSRLPGAEVTTQLVDEFHLIRSIPQLGGAPIQSIRGPLCDGQRSVDRFVLDRAIDAYMPSVGLTAIADSSFGTLGPFARSHGFRPTVGFEQMFLDNFPFPFVVTARSGRTIVEFPFQYPSDGAVQTRFKSRVNLHSEKTPGDPLSFAWNIWKGVFDETYNQYGVMVLLMHQHVEATLDCNDQIVKDHQGQQGWACGDLPWTPGTEKEPTSLIELIRYMRSKPGVFFTDLKDATERFLAVP